MPNIPLVNGHYPVEKRTTQNGFKMSEWTYVVLHDLPLAYQQRKGTLRVRGNIDQYELRQYNLLPLKGPGMLLPLNAAVRKKTGKGAGDSVHIVLFEDDTPFEVPDEILVCLLDAPQAHAFFMTLSESNQKYYIDWIEASKKPETKVNRILRAIEQLENGVKFYDWPG